MNGGRSLESAECVSANFNLIGYFFLFAKQFRPCLEANQNTGHGYLKDSCLENKFIVEIKFLNFLFS